MVRAARILLVDDDASLLRVTGKQLADAGYEVVAAPGGAEALDALVPGETDVVLTDLQMPGMDGIQLLREVKRRDPAAAVVVVTAFGTVEAAVTAMRTGAVDFLEKPYRRETLLLTVEKALRHRALAAENLRLHLELTDRFSFESIVGGSEEMRAVFQTMGRVAQSDAAVLVTGESGTGKELIARAIHYAGARSNGPFVAVNCAAIPEALLESELFGHVRGAFTGATESRTGRFPEADGGTILLDEIGEMRPDLQVKLLRVLSDGEVRPVGGEESRRVDVRLISATNRDLAAAREAGEFREDLYYRIAVVTIEVPPLRRRRDDIPLLANHFLHEHAGAGVRMSAGFLAALGRHRWPGNVRELSNVIRRALVLREEGGVLTEADLPEEIAAGPPPAEGRIVLPDEGLSLAEVERSLIRQALEKTGGNRTRAARLLGITRQTLLYRMEKHGVE